MKKLIVLVAALGLIVGSGVSAPAAEKPPKGAIPLPGGGYAIELKAPQPDWYTEKLHRKVVAAGKQGRTVPIPKRADVDSALLFAGIRPGSWMISPSWCTMNFVFGDPSGGGTPPSGGPGGGGGGGGGGSDDDDQDEGSSESDPDDSDEPQAGSKSKGKGKKNGGRNSSAGMRAGLERQPTGSSGVFIGTAGHCTQTGDEVTLIAAPGVLMNIGTTVRSVDNGIGEDFALVEVYPEMVRFVNPSMAIIAGPTGSAAPAIGDVVLHVGHGVGVGTGGTPRAGVVGWLGDGAEASGYGWSGAASPGDSGSGVRNVQGAAVGNLTHLVIGFDFLPAFIAGTDINRMLQVAGAPLATASLVPDPLP